MVKEQKGREEQNIVDKLNNEESFSPAQMRRMKHTHSAEEQKETIYQTLKESSQELWDNIKNVGNKSKEQLKELLTTSKGFQALAGAAGAISADIAAEYVVSAATTSTKIAAGSGSLAALTLIGTHGAITQMNDSSTNNNEQNN